MNLLESVAIVFIVLLIFMGFKSAAIVGGSLLLTILLTLIYMNLNDIDLHRVSLGTFILALGMLVDNAIVITDMVISKMNKGVERTKAAIDSVKETSVPLFGATVIAIMALVQWCSLKRMQRNLPIQFFTLWPPRFYFHGSLP
ncbi:acriflavin resistance protein [Vibrio astriarenae]|nr:acriflavin resistance protein [Vibrio sp. C7]